MNKKQILDRAYMAKVFAKKDMRACLDKSIENINQADALYNIVNAGIEHYYQLFVDEIADAFKEAKA